MKRPDEIPMSLSDILAYRPCETYDSVDKLKKVSNGKVVGTLKDLLDADVPTFDKLNCIVRSNLIPQSKHNIIKQSLINRIKFHGTLKNEKDASNKHMTSLISDCLLGSCSAYHGKTLREKKLVIKNEITFLLELILDLMEVHREPKK